MDAHIYTVYMELTSYSKLFERMVALSENTVNAVNSTVHELLAVELNTNLCLCETPSKGVLALGLSK